MDHFMKLPLLPQIQFLANSPYADKKKHKQPQKMYIPARNTATRKGAPTCFSNDNITIFSAPQLTLCSQILKYIVLF